MVEARVVDSTHLETKERLSAAGGHNPGGGWPGATGLPRRWNGLGK